MSARFDEKFTPVFEKLKDLFPVLNAEMPKVADGLANMAQGFVDSVTSGPGMDKIRNTIDNIGQALSDAKPGIGDFTDGLLTLASRVSDKLPGLTDLFNGWGDRFKNWVDDITTVDASGTSKLDRALTGIKTTIQSIVDLLGGVGKDGLDMLSDPKMGENIGKFIDSVKDFTLNVMPTLSQFFDDLNGFIDETKTGVQWLIDNIPGLDKLMVPRDKPKNNDGSDKDTSNPFEPFTSEDAPWRDWNIMDIFKDLNIGSLTGVLEGPLDSLKTSLGTTFSGLWTTIVEDAKTHFGELTGFFSNIPSQLQGAWSSLSGIASGAWSAVVTAVQTALSEVVTAVVTKAGEIVAEISSWPGKFVGALGDMGSVLYSAGAALVQGLINGIKSMVGAAVSAAQDAAGQIKDAVTGFFGINSPSKVFHEIGANLGQGLVDGMDSQQKAVEGAAKTMSDTVSEAMNFGDQAGKFGVNSAFDFATANFGQLASDLGISGNGAISEIAKYGLDFGQGLLNKAISGGFGGGGTTNIQVNSLDEALAAKQNLANKQALQFQGR